MSRYLRAMYPLLLVALLVLLPAQAATAIPGIDDCKDAPVAEMPGSGMAGFFGGQPDQIPKDPAGGAWRNGAPMYENYGLAGLSFHTYDLGCIPDGEAAVASFGTTAANWMTEPVKFTVAGLGALVEAAYEPTYLSTFNPLLRNATDTLRTTVYNQWVPLTIALVGAMLIWKARKMELSSTGVIIVWALFVMVLAAAVFAWPVKAGSAADQTVGTVLGTVHKGINGQNSAADPATQATGSITNAVLYQQWKMGTFGRTNSATAEKYAKAIYTNQALTWAEAALVRADPDGAGKDLLEDKADAWEDAAEKIKESDPDAYEYLKGYRSSSRIGGAFVSWVALLAAAPFVLGASLMLIGAYLIIRLAVVFFPLLATVGIAHPLRGAVQGIGTVVAAAIINSLVFGIGMSVVLLASKILLDPASGLPLWLSLALMGIVSVIMWVALKPARSLTKMVKPDGMFERAAGAAGDLADSAKDTAMGVGKQAAAVYAGHKWAMPDASDGDWHEGSPGRYRGEGVGERTEVYSAPAPSSSSGPAGELPAAQDRAPALDAAPVAPAPGGSPAHGPLHVQSETTVIDGGAHRADVTVDAPVAALPAGPSAALPPGSEAPAGESLDRLAGTETPEESITDGDELADGVVFLPGDLPAGAPLTDLPSAATPHIDEETGEAVYDLFVPDDIEAGEGR